MNVGDPELRYIKLLGQGSFGKVILCRSTKSNSLTCVKQISVRNQAEMQMILREIYIISQLKHPRIVHFHKSFLFGDCVSIVMDYAAGGTLRNVIQKLKFQPLRNDQLRRYFCDILNGLEYLHIRQVVHRDLKPENVLLDRDGRVKIADFGISFVTTSTHTGEIWGTPAYMSPEGHTPVKLNLKADIWSLGLILFELHEGFNPLSAFKSLNEMKKIFFGGQVKCISCRRLTPPWASIAEEMLIFNPKERTDIRGIIAKNPYISLYYYNLFFEYDY